MLLRHLAEAIREQRWFTVFVEVLVVVIGIFIGLQVDDWNNERKDRILERRYLERLLDDITLDIDEMRYALDVATERRAMGRMLIDALDDPAVARSDPMRFITAIEQAGYTFLPVINDSTIDEIRFAGHLGIIRNEDLRSQLTSYYKLIDRYAQWGYLREAFQTHYSDAALGILSINQLDAIEMVRRYSDRNVDRPARQIAEEEAVAALERMRRKPDFIDQLHRGTNQGITIQNVTAWKQSAEELQAGLRHELGLPVETGD